MNGYTILGSAPDRVITVRVRNTLALAKGQSALATVASWVPDAGPDFVEGQAYEAIAQKISDALTGQHADAEVRVIDGNGIVPQPQTYFTAAARAPATEPEEGDDWRVARTYSWRVVTGAGLSGLLAVLWHYFLRETP